jgi:CheY-like chemotaxis protein
LRQILVNLVGNAIKFTHEGEITVNVSRADTNKVRFEVRDTGVGIAPAVRQRIFEPFTQADSSHGRRYGGAGLGLSIVARLLEAMGGTVDVSSVQGSGTVFSFVIPLTTDAVGIAPERKPWESALHGKSILVLEPSEMARGAIAEILRSRGVFATSFSRASDAPRGRFACAVTSDPSVLVKPQVVITSPLDSAEYPVRVTRPVGERELIDAVGVALGLTEESPEYTLEPAEPSGTSLRLLLVDDSDVNVEVVSEMLRRLGHDVTAALDGESALATLASRTFDVVFMDVQLPGMDGLEVTRRFRDGGGKAPVVALTAHTSSRDRDRCLAAGMNAVLTKPVDTPHLAAVIDSVTHRRSLADVVGGNMALLARVREAFSRQTPELLLAIRDAIARRDSDALAQHVHKLKGSMSYFPGQRGSDVAREMEQAARAGDLTRAASLMPDLEQAVAELQSVLTDAARR